MEVSRTFDLLDKYSKNFPREDAIAGKMNGKWRKFSSQAYAEQSNQVALGLLCSGFEPGCRLATITNNRPEWNFLDMGMAMAGIVHVPIYSSLNDDEYVFILNHSEARAVFVSDKTLYQKISGLAARIPAISHIYCFNEHEGIPQWTDIQEKGKRADESIHQRLKAIQKEITPDQLFSIIYTSGTTGSPKGVMLSHRNIVSNFVASSAHLPLGEKDKILSFLPLSHVYERMMNYCFQYKGVGIYYAENMGTIVDNLKEIQADGFNSVPRLLETVFDKIMARGKALTGISRLVFFWSLNLGLRYEFNRKNGWWYHFQLGIARRLVFSKWKIALGGRLRLIVSGGSALQPRLARVFWAAGIPVLEGYGLTESSPVITANRYREEDSKFGTVGQVMEGSIIKIAADGEILCKGPNVMMGYFRDQGATQEVIDEEGWLHTGDIGELVDGKFLRITDRKKEIFKLSNGKYVAPQPIENRLKESMFIEQSMVIGENQKFASALIAPNFPYLHDWCSLHHIPFRDNHELVRLPQVFSRFQKEIDKANKSLNPHEQIKRFRLVTEEWSPKTGELSLTLKLKRNVIINKYQSIMEEPNLPLKNVSAAETGLEKASTGR